MPFPHNFCSECPSVSKAKGSILFHPQMLLMQFYMRLILYQLFNNIIFFVCVLVLYACMHICVSAVACHTYSSLESRGWYQGLPQSFSTLLFELGPAHWFPQSVCPGRSPGSSCLYHTPELGIQAPETELDIN